MNETPNYDFYKKALLEAPNQVPDWFQPTLENNSQKDLMPTVQRWWKDLSKPCTDLLINTLGNQNKEVPNADDIELGTYLADKGMLDFMKKPALAGVKEEMNEWHNKLKKSVITHQKMGGRNSTRQFFYWKQYYAINLCRLAGEDIPYITSYFADTFLDERPGFPKIEIVKEFEPEPKEVAL
jgi:hypothetical protein